jgi:hypothetical protein
MCDVQWHRSGTEMSMSQPLSKATQVPCFRAFQFFDTFRPVQAAKYPQKQSHSEGGSESRESLGFVEVGLNTLEQCWDPCQMMTNQQFGQKMDSDIHIKSYSY